MPCFWWSPFRSFGVSEFLGSFPPAWEFVLISDVIAKVSSFKKVQKDYISYIGIRSFSAVIILSQAAKDREKKDSKHESRDTNKPHECHKRYHDIGHTNWSYRQHVCFTQAQERSNHVFLCWMCVHSQYQYLHSLDTVQSTLLFFALFVSKTLINHGWYHQF